MKWKRRGKKKKEEENFSIYDYPIEYLKLEYPYVYEDIILKRNCRCFY
jgi:hypothetical protein